MKDKKQNKLTSQKVIPFIGELQQIIGGSMLWFSMFTFVFSGIAAWNTNTMQELRDIFPIFSNIFVFAGVILLGMVVIMWLQHKYVQASVIAYFNKMQYMTNPLNEDVRNNQKAILKNQEAIERVEAIVKELKDSKSEISK